MDHVAKHHKSSARIPVKRQLLVFVPHLDLRKVAVQLFADVEQILELVDGGRVGLFAAPPNVMEVFEISGFRALLDLYPDRSAALRQVAASSS